MSHQKDRSEALSAIRPNNLSVAIASILAVPAATAVAQDQDQNEGSLLEEVIVTATKRAQNLQDIPQSIQAITADTIRVAGMQSMEDYVRFIPSMNIVIANPGTATIVFRGVADAQSTFIAESSAALYLDEQSLTMNGNPNPRMVDIERVEALSGPQGTLFGASSQSGVLRIVTNKPDPSAFDANIDVMLRGMSEGEASYDVSAMGNIPISDTFAVRLVGFSARDGGFIDNVLGTTPRFELFTNEDKVKEDFNRVEYKGGRISAKWFPNDNWQVTAGIVYQKTDSDGRPEQDVHLDQDLAVVRFKPGFEYDNQDWTQYALTIEGDLGFADFVSATAYFTRDWEYTQDTTPGYAAYFGTFCYGGSYDPDGNYNPYISNYANYCFQPAGVGNYYNDPIGYLKNTQKNTKFSQEFRLSAQGERVDWVAGVFYEEASEDWDFWSFTDGYDESQVFDSWVNGRMAWKGSTPTQSPQDAWWFSADRTDWEQKAVFGEGTFHLGEKWDLTLGARWFDRTMNKRYWNEIPQFNPTDDGVLNPTSDVSDWLGKASLKYQVNDDIMVYGLYSEGFRPGGTNRGRGEPWFPREFDTDWLNNYELGTKMTLADGNVRLNATYFHMKWEDYQLELIDPSNIACGAENARPEPTCGQPWQKVVFNAGDATSEGIELQLDAALSKNFTLGFNATWLDATLDEEVEALVTIPKGSRLPLSPDFQGAVYGQYDWPVNWFGGSATSAYVRLQWSYTGSMLNQVEPLSTPEDGPSPQIKQPAYNIGDIRFGVNGNDWSVQLFVNNLTDERAILFDNPYELDRFFGRGRQTVNRPREYGVRFIKSFGK
jgi:outer membrane receptor protein involved in Fe transport